ncbi:hypothetical protein ALC53_05284 [Atta colombica]|uniref:Uncharacterized protein n=1 Tax=Atta colombica TaxID=520822 RepID=A0A195BI20_9HYME|nr:hypothetical protein ALC53_05284 [Atta colombica]
MCASVQLHRKHHQHGTRTRSSIKEETELKKKEEGSDLGKGLRARNQTGNDHIVRERSAERL